MRTVRHILFLIVAMVLLTHSAVPHDHHDQMSDLEDSLAHENSESLADELGLLFHQNIVATLNSIKDLQFVSLSELDSYWSHFWQCGILDRLRPHQVGMLRSCSTFLSHSFKSCLLTSIGTRGPPILSFINEDSQDY